MDDAHSVGGGFKYQLARPTPPLSGLIMQQQRIFCVEYRYPGSYVSHWESSVSARDRGGAANYVRNLHPGADVGQVRFIRTKRSFEGVSDIERDCDRIVPYSDL